MKLKAIILAAGEGKRMKSKLPKVIHKVCGETMLQHVMEAATKANASQQVVVVGHGAEKVIETLPKDVSTVLQEQQKGTGHAVMMAKDYLEDEGTVIVLYGDGPLITPATLLQLQKYHNENNNNATVLTAVLDNPHGYGRIVRDTLGNLEKIVEEKDASIEEKVIDEINSGIYCFNSKDLKEALPLLKNDNAQGEYYLTDVLTILKHQSKKIGLFKIEDYEDIMAVNSRQQLAQVEAIMRKRINNLHMINGVTFIDANSTYIGKKVKIGMDTVIYPGVILEGDTIIGEECIIGPNCHIMDSIIGDAVEIHKSTVKESKINSHSVIGPYAYLRPGSNIGSHVKIGDFVEVKNSTIGDHSKASHLAYIGDATVGENVNIGCGVVFVNYDGKKKHPAIVEDNAFIGSNSNLVAPIKINEGGYVACGSTITRDVPKGALAISRVRQENKENWNRRK